MKSTCWVLCLLFSFSVFTDGLGYPFRGSGVNLSNNLKSKIEDVLLPGHHPDYPGLLIYKSPGNKQKGDRAFGTMIMGGVVNVAGVQEYEEIRKTKLKARGLTGDKLLGLVNTKLSQHEIHEFPHAR